MGAGRLSTLVAAPLALPGLEEAGDRRGGRHGQTHAAEPQRGLDQGFREGGIERVGQHEELPPVRAAEDQGAVPPAERRRQLHQDLLVRAESVHQGDREALRDQARQPRGRNPFPLGDLVERAIDRLGDGFPRRRGEGEGGREPGQKRLGIGRQAVRPEGR